MLTESEYHQYIPVPPPEESDSEEAAGRARIQNIEVSPSSGLASVGSFRPFSLAYVTLQSIQPYQPSVYPTAD